MNEICPHCGKVSTEESPRFCSGCGARMDGSTPAPAPALPQKNQTVALSYSSVLPGLGQVYNGQTAKGFAIFIFTVAGLIALLIPGIIIWLYGMYDAYAVAGKMNTGVSPFVETRTLHMVLFVVFAVAVIVIVVLIIIAIVTSYLMTLLGPLGTGNFNRMLGNSRLF